MTLEISRRGALGLLGVAGLSLLTSTTKKEAPLKYCLGKNPASENKALKLRDYIHPTALPKPPENFGHENLVSDWKMLGNDNAGDCAFAGPFHAEMLWCAEGKKAINVNTQCVLEAYSAVTGYDPNARDYLGNNPTDQGANVQQVAEYWRTTGLKDADGNVHKIDCYLALEPGNYEQLYQAMYLFGGVGIGVELPEEFQESFQHNQVWDRLSHPHIEGGHYILGVGSRAGLINTVTWGATQLLTPAGYEQFNDETFVYFNEERLINGRDIEGFRLEDLLADLAGIAEEEGVTVPPLPTIC